MARTYRYFSLPMMLLSMASLVQAGGVKLELQKDQVVIKIDGQPFTNYNVGDAQNKPYFHPVYAPGQVQVVREQVFGPDGQQGNDAKTGLGHFHHKGIWIAIDTVNDGLNYWHEKHKILNQDLKIQHDGDHGILKVVNHWLDDEHQPLLKESTTFTFTPDRLIVCDLTLTAIDHEVTFGDTKEGLFAVRVVHELRGLSGGEIVNSRDEQGESECWGKPAPWVDYHGKVDGKLVGISLFDHPDNFRPSRYHVRGYGLFAINPFGEKKYSNGKQEAAPVTLGPGHSLKLRYGLYVHQGDEQSGEVADQYQQFIKLP